jgi:hypothetical protein
MRRATAALILIILPVFVILSQAGVASAVTLNCTGATCTFVYLGAGSCSTAGQVVTVTYTAIAGGIECKATCIAGGSTAILVRDATGKLIDSVPMNCRAACGTDPGSALVAGTAAQPDDLCGSSASVPEFSLPVALVVSTAFVLFAIMTRLRASRAATPGTGI